MILGPLTSLTVKHTLGSKRPVSYTHLDVYKRQLGIKLRRFIDALSDEALACAEEADFPIIELPFELAWADIITPVLDEVLDRQAEVLQRSIGVHTQFIHTVLRGGGMPDIAATLSEQIRAPVAIVDNRWTILASAGSLNDACPNLDMSWSEFIGMLRAAMLKKEQVKITRCV